VIYADDLEAACPGTWLLGGDWECGTPTSGPGAAYSGAQVLATILNGNYSNGQSWLTNTASSGPISLMATTAPQLFFRVWYQTEGLSYDGFNVKVSNDGGMTYAVLPMVTPAYNLTVSTESAWGGTSGGQQWSLFSADLSAYAGQAIQVQFAMRTDGTVNYPGVYVDNVIITD
jgi:bacillopeptidase F (M6 metalloprotease family)